MAATRWRRFSSMSRAGANGARRRNERTCANHVLAAPRRRDGAALLVSVAFVVGAPHRADLLAHGADADVGLPADLSGEPDQPLRTGRRSAGWRGDVVGHPVPR